MERSQFQGFLCSINPSDSHEQKIWWWKQYGDVLDCSYGWDDDGDRYIHVTAYTENRYSQTLCPGLERECAREMSVQLQL